MFDTLTEDERHALHLKLCAGVCKFGAVSHTLARVALANGEYEGELWDRRERYTAASAELNVLRAEVLAA